MRRARRGRMPRREPVADLGDARLWGRPLVSGKRIPWDEGGWVELPIIDTSVLESARTTGTPAITFGVWGTSGNGLYGISSRESGAAPELVLEVEDPPKNSGQLNRLPPTLNF